MSEGLNRRSALNAKPEKLERKEAVVKSGWAEQERRAAKAIPGGKVVKGSGCSKRASRKSDVSGHWIRCESKTTANVKDRGLRITRDVLMKIQGEAMLNRQLPALMFGFDYSPKWGPRQDWIGFPVSVAHRMMAVVEAAAQGDLQEARELAELLTKAG